MTDPTEADPSGTGRPVLALLPGMLCDEALWRPQIAALEARCDCRVADLTGPDSIAGMAEAALERLPERFALAGLSMGGYVALEIMRRAPERVARLALLDTKARVDTAEATARRHDLMTLARGGGFEAATERLLPLFLHQDRLGDAPLVEAVRAMTARVGRDAFLRQQTAILHRGDLLSHLPGIACPTLALCGRQDALTPVDCHEEIAAAIPGARLEVIEDCGHLATMERPEAVNAALEAWLAG